MIYELLVAYDTSGDGALNYKEFRSLVKDVCKFAKKGKKKGRY